MRLEDENPVRERLLSAVRSMSQVLRDGALESERQRRLSSGSVEALRKGALLGCAAPAAVGGLEAHPLTQLELFEAVAAIDGAAGWCLMVSSLFGQYVGARLSAASVGKLFPSAERFPSISGLIWPRGQARVVDGGYEVTGRWGFVSGIEHADWVLGGCLVHDRDGPRHGPDGTSSVLMALFPREAVVVYDTWRTTGLRGSGSGDFAVERAFVPKALAFAASSPALRGLPWSRQDLSVISSVGHSGFAIGLAKAALRDLECMGPATASESECFRSELGRSVIALDAARALVWGALSDLWEESQDGRSPTEDELRRLRAISVHATEVAVRLAQFAFRSTGSSGLFDSHPSQRRLRDAWAAQQHHYVRTEAYVQLGSVRVGATT